MKKSILVASLYISVIWACGGSEENPQILSRKFCNCAKVMQNTAQKIKHKTTLSTRLVAEANQGIEEMIFCLGGQEIWTKIFSRASKHAAKTEKIIQRKCPSVWKDYQLVYSLN